MRRDITSQETNYQVSEYDTMTGEISWRVILGIEVARYDAVEISPADEDADCDAAFVASFEVV